MLFIIHLKSIFMKILVGRPRKIKFIPVKTCRKSRSVWGGVRRSQVPIFLQLFICSGIARSKGDTIKYASKYYTKY